VERGLIGLGRMGGNLRDRVRAVHAVGPSGTPGQLAGPSSGVGPTPS
jgi:hypothetical protein